MKILFVTTYPLEYNLSANVRNWGLIEGLLANGNSVSTLSSYPTDRNLYNGVIETRGLLKRYWIGENHLKSELNSTTALSSWKSKLKTLAYNLFNYISVYDRRVFLKRVIRFNEINEQFDIIISSSDPKSAHVFALELFKKRPDIGKKWIQYWGDPFSNDISVKRLFGNFFVNIAEKKLIKLADKVVYVSPFTTLSIQSKYPEYKDKIVFLPIPYRLSGCKDNGSYNTGLIGYFGDYSSSNRNILPFYEALKETGYDANIIGNSDVHLDSCENITIKSRIPSQDLENIASKTHVFVCICNLSGTQIPGKVYHYVNRQKPILIILDGDKQKELRDYFESYDRFYLCDNNKISIVETLHRIIRSNEVFKVPDALNPTVIADKFLIK